MPFSSPLFDLEIREFITAIKPKRCLDVGPGAGRYGKLIREIVPDAVISAIEPEDKYIDRYMLDNLYDDIVKMDVSLLIRRGSFHWGDNDVFDLVVYGDVLEHMTYSLALDTIHYFAYRCRYFLAQWPSRYIQYTYEGSHYEVHRCSLDFWDFRHFDRWGSDMLQDNLNLITARGFVP